MILEVADIRQVHAALVARDYPEAWPIGPFWPSALTSGVAIGGLNLELYQPLDREPSTPAIQRLAFQATNLEDAARALESLGLRHDLQEKIEEDPTLLRLRGFSGAQPEQICRNLFPVEPPLPFFFCEYTPFLKERLAPGAHQVLNPVTRITYGLASGEAWQVVETLGLAVSPLEFVEADRTGVIRMTPDPFGD